MEMLMLQWHLAFTLTLYSSEIIYCYSIVNVVVVVKKHLFLTNESRYALV